MFPHTLPSPTHRINQAKGLRHLLGHISAERGSGSLTLFFSPTLTSTSDWVQKVTRLSPQLPVSARSGSSLLTQPYEQIWSGSRFGEAAGVPTWVSGANPALTASLRLRLYWALLPIIEQCFVLSVSGHRVYSLLVRTWRRKGVSGLPQLQQFNNSMTNKGQNKPHSNSISLLISLSSQGNI